jgi:hypothetical protein
LVQANELGVNSIGYDISAFNVLLSNVKTMEYDTKLLSMEMTDLLSKFRDLTRNKTQLELWDNHLNQYSIPTNSFDNEYLQKWFAPKALNELLIFRDLIYQGNYVYKDLYKIILSRASRSARLTTHFDLDFPKNP